MLSSTNPTEMMTEQLSIEEYQVMWVVGAAERLATLGMLDANVPLKLTPQSVDTFIAIDEYRNHLFKSDYQIVEIFKALAANECDDEPDDENLKQVANLILEYKNNRTELVKYALSHQTH